jgi:hypothetical protein
MWSRLNPHIFHEVPSHSTKNLCVVLVSSEKFWLLSAIRNWVCNVFPYWTELNGIGRCRKMTQLHTWWIPLWQCWQSSLVMWFEFMTTKITGPDSTQFVPLASTKYWKMCGHCTLLTICLMSANDKRLNCATGKCKSLPSLSSLFTSSVNL